MGKKKQKHQETGRFRRSDYLVAKTKDDVERPKRNVGNAQKTKLSFGRHERNQFRCCERKQAYRERSVKTSSQRAHQPWQIHAPSPSHAAKPRRIQISAYWKVRSDMKLFVILHEKHRDSHQECPAPTCAPQQTENQSRNRYVK